MRNGHDKPYLNGYSTAQFGKCHEVPAWETSPVGPFERWPTGSGFEYFFGFIGGETNQWYPALYENTTPIEPDRTPEQACEHGEQDTLNGDSKEFPSSRMVSPCPGGSDSGLNTTAMSYRVPRPPR